jgi:L-amino acid N-acyltransferase YncA
MVAVPFLREATPADIDAIRAIYNEGIADRVATLDESLKSGADLEQWWNAHGGRYTVLVAERDGKIVGWTSLNSYSQRNAYRGVADLSIYVARHARGTGIGSLLLERIERIAKAAEFYKIVIAALASNEAGRALYGKMGYRLVGTYLSHGRLDGVFVDVIALEKMLA